ncbi:MAG: ALIX V-shaped domain binding to HIV-domain-containing protein, partial [Olpidium bornovanus]
MRFQDKWTRPPSSVLTKSLMDQGAKHMANLEAAKKSDAIVKKKLAEYSPAIEVLGRSRVREKSARALVPCQKDLEAAVPQSLNVSPEQHESVAKLRQLMDETDRMRRQRKDRIDEARKISEADDIGMRSAGYPPAPPRARVIGRGLCRVVTNTRWYCPDRRIAVRGALCRKPAEVRRAKAPSERGLRDAGKTARCDNGQSLGGETSIADSADAVRSNLRLLDLILRTPPPPPNTPSQEANKNFVASRRNNPGAHERDKAIQNLNSAYDKFRQISANLQEGQKFYLQFEDVLSEFGSNCKDYCYARKMESNDYLSDLMARVTGMNIGDRAGANTPAEAPGPKPPLPPRHYGYGPWNVAVTHQQQPPPGGVWRPEAELNYTRAPPSSYSHSDGGGIGGQQQGVPAGHDAFPYPQYPAAAPQQAQQQQQQQPQQPQQHGAWNPSIPL